MTSPAEAVILSKIKANGPSLSDLQSDIRGLGPGGVPTTRLGSINRNFEVSASITAGNQVANVAYSVGTISLNRSMIFWHGWNTTSTIDNNGSVPAAIFSSGNMIAIRGSVDGSTTWTGKIVEFNP